MKKEKVKKSFNSGITLLALVITIIILIILAGVALVFVLGENGIVDRAKEASFKSNLSEIEEKVLIYWQEKTQEEIMNGANYRADEKLPVSTVADNSEFSNSLKDEILDVTGKDGNNVELYIIDKTKITTSASHTYLIDIEAMQVYDMEGEHFGGKTHHTLKGLGSTAEGGGTGSAMPAITTNPEIAEDGEIGWLKPDLTGFNAYHTTMIYYNKEDFNDLLRITIVDYLDPEKYNRASTIEQDGKIYVLDGYKDKIWANVYLNSNQVDTWWVWLPRYAYCVNRDAKNVDIVFVDMNNNPIGQKYKEKYTKNADGTITIKENAEDETGITYTVHPGFTEKTWTSAEVDGETVVTEKIVKELQGVWMSKYQIYDQNSATKNPSSGKCYEPDLEGFDKKYTYIELYNTTGDNAGNFVAPETDSQLANNITDFDALNSGDTIWYDYSRKIWANIKTVANGVEDWWVWIPRYAYCISTAGTEVDIIFIDTFDKPMDKEEYGDRLPNNFTVHPGFNTADGKKLKGIWMSKYQITEVNNDSKNASSGVCLPPNLTGFDNENTYIELYSTTGDNEGNFVAPEASSQLLKNISDTSTLNSGDDIWYDYSRKIWANIKTVANGAECWWVWIPRYAYCISTAGKESDVIFVNMDNTPCDKETYGDTLPEGFIVHPGFTEKTWTTTEVDGETVVTETVEKELDGIWMSKYQIYDT